MFRGVELILPRHCIQCGLWLTSQEPWRLGCAACEGRWPDLRGPEGELLMRERCMMHRMWTGFRLRENATLEGQIHALKYKGRRRLGQNWGRWVASSTPTSTSACFCPTLTFSSASLAATCAFSSCSLQQRCYLLKPSPLLRSLSHLSRSL